MQLEVVIYFPDMIPTKMLVYKGTDGGTHSQTFANTRRRKKSTGELFQKGYRVRMGHGPAGDKEDQESFCFSLGSCCHVISYWGKRRRGITPGDWLVLQDVTCTGSDSGLVAKKPNLK